MVDEQMVIPAIEEDAEPVAEVEEEHVIAPIVDIAEGQMDALVMDMEEDLAALFGDDDFEDDPSDGFGEEEVWEVNEDCLMAPTTPPPMLRDRLSLTQPQESLVNQVSDVEVAAGVTIGELGLRVYAVEGHVQTAAQRDETIVELTQQVQALQIDVQQRDTQIQQLQTTVTEMGSRESTLMRCILGLVRRIAALERRPPGLQ
ncbi:hypothetical protein Tco_0923222 [Tanacetum coccineum]|uniref:Uncharacterized protein n=1 Tax=Tanacetum coccineum TaxID=301880 RepID=A0ABQ5D3P1_9ASTR